MYYFTLFFTLSLLNFVPVFFQITLMRADVVYIADVYEDMSYDLRIGNFYFTSYSTIYLANRI